MMPTAPDESTSTRPTLPGATVLATETAKPNTAVAITAALGTRLGDSRAHDLGASRRSASEYPIRDAAYTQELSTDNNAMNTTTWMMVAVAGMCIAFIIMPNGLAATAGEFHGASSTVIAMATT